MMHLRGFLVMRAGASKRAKSAGLRRRPQATIWHLVEDLLDLVGLSRVCAVRGIFVAEIMSIKAKVEVFDDVVAKG